MGIVPCLGPSSVFLFDARAPRCGAAKDRVVEGSSAFLVLCLVRAEGQRDRGTDGGRRDYRRVRGLFGDRSLPVSPRTAQKGAEECGVLLPPPPPAPKRMIGSFSLFE